MKFQSAVAAGSIGEPLRNTTDHDIERMIAFDPDTAPDMSNGRDWRSVLLPRIPDVQTVRRKLGLSQSEFAARFGFSVRTIQEWEQGRAVPDRPARILLRVIEKVTQAVGARRGRRLIPERDQLLPLLPRIPANQAGSCRIYPLAALRTLSRAYVVSQR